MSADGVFIDMFFLSILDNFPDKKDAVPEAMRKASLLLDGFGSPWLRTTSPLPRSSEISPISFALVVVPIVNNISSQKRIGLYR